MTEGELYGEVPEEKIDKVEKKIAMRNKFSEQISKLKGAITKEDLDSEIKDRFFSRAQQLIESLDREIILKGAPYKLKAEVDHMKLFGSENEDTREESTDIVRDYIYQKDRLRQFSGLAKLKGGSPLALENIKSSILEKWRQLKGSFSGKSKSRLAEGDTISSFSDKLRELKEKMQSDNIQSLEQGNIDSSYLEKINELKEKIQSGKIQSLENENIESSFIEKLRELKEKMRTKELSYLLDFGELSLLDNIDSESDFSKRIQELREKYEQNKNSNKQTNSQMSIKSLLAGKYSPNQSLNSDMSLLISQAQEQGKTELVNMLEDCKKTYDSIDNLQNTSSISTSAPSRKDNPYKSVKDLQKLQAMLNETESRIQTVVIDKRNQETAENFTKALKAGNTTVGILQFGAGHEEGLVKELNKQGITVIVVKPSEVLRRKDATNSGTY